MATLVNSCRLKAKEGHASWSYLIDLDDDTGSGKITDDRHDEQYGVPDLAVALVLFELPDKHKTKQHADRNRADRNHAKRHGLAEFYPDSAK